MTYLKPCPFCGCDAYVFAEHRRLGHGDNPLVLQVRCVNCTARTESSIMEFTGRQADIERKAWECAVERWNRRVE